MRKVINIPTQKVILCNVLGRELQSFKVENGECFLPIFNAELCFKAGGMPFYVYGGEGDLAFKDCLKRYDFNDFDKSLLKKLDFYLRNRAFEPKTSADEKKMIKDFVEISNINLSKMSDSSAGDYFAFDGFSDLEGEIYGV